MCGIAGWISTNSSRPIRREILERMRERIAHRGPDGAGLWIDSDSRVGLGFRRLAIIDLAPQANQPMSNEDGSLRLVFNGEIYNHVALRKQLEGLGHRFRTDHSDTETIVHGYEEWGEGVVERLEGMFSIALWEVAQRRLFLARDRVGIKPLYIAWTPSAFLFASEIKAILAHPEITPEIEPISVYHYLSFLTAPAPLTMFRGVYKIPAGHRGHVTLDGEFRAERYWDALPGMGVDADATRSLSGGKLRSFAVQRVRQLLDEAVQKRMMSDVPFGVFLSGGIDSSVNVALMTKHLGRPVKTFTVGFSDWRDLNELDYAREVAALFQCEHHEILIDERAMRDYLPRLVYTQDEPIADWVCIPLFFLSQLARDSGTVVVQVGEGSDEQFCGYRSYMAYLSMYRRWWRPFTSLVPGPARRAGAWIAERAMSLDDRHDRYWDLIARAGRDREPFWSGATVFSESRKSRLIDKALLPPLQAPDPVWRSGILPPDFGRADSFQIIRSFFARLDKESTGADFLTRMTYSEFKLRLSELLLMRIDKIAMSASIEPRVPYLDHKLVEFTMNLPWKSKVGDGVSKSLLKEAVRGLIPDRIIDRPKMGFGAPMSDWLRHDFGHVVEAELESTRFFQSFPADRGQVIDMVRRHRSGHTDFAIQIWTLYNAVAWFDSWIDGKAEVRVA